MKEILKSEEVQIILHEVVHKTKVGVAHLLDQACVVHQEVQVLADEALLLSLHGQQDAYVKVGCVVVDESPMALCMCCIHTTIPKKSTYKV